jgi:hypothetical protein
LECPSQVFEKQQQLERVHGRRFEFEVFIESPSRFINGMDHDPDCHDVGARHAVDVPADAGRGLESNELIGATSSARYAAGPGAAISGSPMI